MTEEVPNIDKLNKETDKPLKQKHVHSDSQLLGVSIRAWLALIIVGTVCVMSFRVLNVVEPLYSMGTMALGFYFGQKTQGVTTKNE